MDLDLWEMSRCPDRLSSCLPFDNRETEKMVGKLEISQFENSYIGFVCSEVRDFSCKETLCSLCNGAA